MTYPGFVSSLQGITFSNDTNGTQARWISYACHAEHLLVGKVIPSIHDSPRVREIPEARDIERNLHDDGAGIGDIFTDKRTDNIAIFFGLELRRV